MNFAFFCWTKSKIWYKYIHLWQTLKQFSILRVNIQSNLAYLDTKYSYTSSSRWISAGRNVFAYILSHLPLEKIAAIWRTPFSGALPWMKSFYFDSNFTEVCSQWSRWRWGSIGSDNNLAPNRWQAITWTNANPVHWRIYVVLGEMS